MVVRMLASFLLLPLALFSAEFTASVNRTQVHMGEVLTLTLTLKDASAQGSPALGALKQTFNIHSQQQAVSTRVVNGYSTSSMTWKIALTPKHEGEAVIPPIGIHTGEGMLASEPVKIKVLKGEAPGVEDSELSGISLATEVSKDRPYKNEPLFYTIRLTSKQDIANVGLQKFNIQDAVWQPNGDPKVYTKIIDGVRANVVEFSYIITPLKSGAIKIPAIAIEGGIPIKRKPRRGSIFDDDFEPFILLGDRLKPFTLMTKEVELDVRPPAAGMNPWLPAKSLTIKEELEGAHGLKVGEPIVRKFKIEAEGLLASQLPALDERQVGGAGFKAYADKPEMGEEIKNGTIHSFRKEQYTLIPQQPGGADLPEVAIEWWNLSRNEKAVARAASRTIEVLPAADIKRRSAASSAPDLSAVEAPVSQETAVEHDPYFIAMAVGLWVLLCGAVFWVLALRRKLARFAEKPPAKRVVKQEAKLQKKKAAASAIKPKAKEKSEKLPDLNPT